MTDKDEVYLKILLGPNGLQKIAAVMTNPLRLQLKELHGIEMNKEHEYIVEAAVLTEKPATYRDAVILQDRLLKQIVDAAERR